MLFRSWQAKERAQSASLDLIAGEGGENSRLRNAVRHSLWIALMIGEYGISEHDALLFGIAHEMDNGGDNGWTTSDSKIDRHNNFIGAQVGSDVRQWKASNPSGSAYDEAVQRILDLTATSNSCSSCLNLTGST